MKRKIKVCLRGWDAEKHKNSKLGGRKEQDVKFLSLKSPRPPEMNDGRHLNVMVVRVCEESGG